MPKKLFVILIILSLLLSGNAIIKNVKGDKANGEGINVSWGQFQHDSRHTGRSNADMSNNTGEIKWKLQVWKEENPDYNTITWADPIIMNKNGIIYMPYDGWIIDSRNGVIKGKINLNRLETNINKGYYILPQIYRNTQRMYPRNLISISNKGYIYLYIPGEDDTIYSIYPNGTLRWKYKSGDIYINGEGGILYNKILYLKGSNSIYAIDENKKLIWRYTLPCSLGNLSNIITLPVVSNNGTLYFAAFVTDSDYLYALNPNGTLKWKYHFTTENWDSIGKPSISWLSIGDDGTIYFLTPSNFYAVKSDGTLKWKNRWSDYLYISGPAIGYDGTIYMEQHSKVSALNPNGTLRWKMDDVYPNSPIITDSKGNIFFTSWENYNLTMFMLNSNGTVKWNKTIENVASAPTYPIIGKDGTIYMEIFHRGYNGGCYLYAIGNKKSYKNSYQPEVIIIISAVIIIVAVASIIAWKKVGRNDRKRG